MNRPRTLQDAALWTGKTTCRDFHRQKTGCAGSLARKIAPKPTESSAGPGNSQSSAWQSISNSFDINTLRLLSRALATLASVLAALQSLVVESIQGDRQGFQGPGSLWRQRAAHEIRSTRSHRLGTLAYPKGIPGPGSSPEKTRKVPSPRTRTSVVSGLSTPRRQRASPYGSVHPKRKSAPAARAMQLQHLARGLVAARLEGFSLGSPNRDQQSNLPVALTPLQPSPGQSHEVSPVLTRDRIYRCNHSKGPEPLVGVVALRPDLPQDLRNSSLNHPNDALAGFAKRLSPAHY